MMSAGVQQLSGKRARVLRLNAQRLDQTRSSPGAARPVEILTAIAGVQAQDPAAARLALRARSTGLTLDDIQRDQTGTPVIARTWCMRGTLHLMAVADLDWMLPLLAPRFIKLSGRRFAELGLTPEIRRDASRVIKSLLERTGMVTREELITSLASSGLPTEGQAGYHLIRYAGLKGFLLYGVDEQGEPLFAAMESWQPLSDAGERREAWGRLARRYLAAFGPAGPEDMAAWAGIPVTDARKAFDGISEQLRPVSIEGSPAWLLKDAEPEISRLKVERHIVNLVPAFDSYLLGYKGRKLAVPAKFERRIHPGGGILRPALLIDGKAAGVWKFERAHDRVTVSLSPFFGLAAEVLERIEEEAADIGRFLGVQSFFEVAPVSAS